MLAGGEIMVLRRKIWIGVLLLGMWLVVAPIALAGEGPDDFTIRITISKTLAVAGDAISVTGSGAEPSVAVNVLIVPDPASGANARSSKAGSSPAGRMALASDRFASISIRSLSTRPRCAAPSHLTTPASSPPRCRSTPEPVRSGVSHKRDAWEDSAG